MAINWESNVFGIDEARTVIALIDDGQRDTADAWLRHLTHVGVKPTELFEIAMALARQEP